MKAPNKSGLLPMTLLLIFAFLFECLLGNFTYFTHYANNGEARNHPAGFGNVTLNEERDYFIVDNLGFEVNSLAFTASLGEDSGAEAADVQLGIYAKHSAQETSYSKVAQENITVTDKEEEITVYFSSQGECESLYITFGKPVNAVNVSAVKVNCEYEFTFNIYRFLIIVLFLCAITALRNKETVHKIKQTKAADAGIVSAAICIFVALMTGILINGKDFAFLYDKSMPLEGLDPYAQQFDAFLKGQLHFDIEPSKELLALENPYDPRQRDGVYYLWDRAFFDGKYYSYFGITPILTIYYPFYLLTGMIPECTLAIAVFAVVNALFMPLAVMELYKITAKNTSPWFGCVVAVSAFFASMATLIERGNSPFYYLASMAAMAMISAFVFFMLKAISAEKQSSKYFYFVFAGVFFGLAFHSRINAALPFGIAAVTFVAINAVKRFKKKELGVFAAESVCLGLPVAIALAFSLWYNNARFGNSLDFGANYQLTVADVSQYRIGAYGIVPSIYHYFFHPFKAEAVFPFINLQHLSFGNYGEYVYIDSGLGIFSFPFMIMLVLTPIVIANKKIPSERRILLGVSLASVFITAFIDFCLGGVIFRYTADISLMAAFVASVAAFELAGIVCERLGVGASRLFKYIVTAIGAATVIIGIATLLIDNGNLNALPYEAEKFTEELFVFWK